VHQHPIVARSRTRLSLRALRVALIAAVVAGGVASRVQAQDAIDSKSAMEIRDRYLADLDTLHSKVMALANAIPDDKYDWRPTPGVRSVSEALMHIASEWYYYTPMSVAMKAPEGFGAPQETLPKLEKITKKADVIAELNKSWDHCKGQLTGADPSKLTGKYKPWGVSLPEAAFGMAGDLHEHLGQMIAYARSVGVKPPWSK
jgi:DinB superfamily